MIAEWLGHFLGQFPPWIGLSVAFLLVTLSWAAWMMMAEPGASDIIDRWFNRRKRERKLENGKK